jgi:hypothetical protein
MQQLGDGGEASKEKMMRLTAELEEKNLPGSIRPSAKTLVV